jgi:hypothetical protein
MEKSFELTSFLSHDEVKLLLKFYSILPKTLNYGSEKKAYTTGFDLDDLDKTPIKNFKTRLTNVFGQHKVTVSMFLEEFDPWTVHSDYHKADKNPYFAVLIPLAYDNDTHTIIFNESGVKEQWKENLIDTGFAYEPNHLRLLSHVDEEILTKLSIKKIYKWNKGNMIAWHRSLLHASDNFPVNGTKKKTALVLFLNQDD